MADGRSEDEEVREAAEHAARAVQERQAMQRRAAQAQAADGTAEAELERESAEHGHAAHVEEARAQDSAREADRSTD